MTSYTDHDEKGTIEHVKKSLALRLGSERMALWFQGNVNWELREQQLRLTFDNDFLSECVKSFCIDDLRAVLAETIGDSARVQILSDPLLAARAPKSEPEVQGELQLYSPDATTDPIRYSEGSVVSSRAARSLENGASRTDGKQSESDFGKGSSRPDPRDGESVYRGDQSSRPPSSWTETRPSMKVDHWSEFLDGESNRLAKTAAQMVLERPGTLTPLLVHGPSGVGKTHLLRGIAEQLRVRHQYRRVIYLTAEQFTIDFTDSARGSGFATFRKKYRDVDAMVIDDIQFFMGKGATLIELRNTVDNLIRSNRQVVFSSDRSLAELSGIGSELHARIAGGMTCVMDPLDDKCRVELLARLAARYQLEMSPSIMETLVRLTSGDARVIHGLVFRILTAQRAKGRKLDDAEIIEGCQDLVRASQPIVRMTDIEKAVCEVFGLDPKSLQAKSKAKTISQPRMLAMFLARKYTRAAYSEIGQYFGNRQHSTVISAQKKVEDWLESNLSMDHNRGSISVREMLRNLEATLQVG